MLKSRTAQEEELDPATRHLGLDDDRLDLSELPVGEYSVRVWAVDAWGRGPVSETVSFFVVNPPPPPPVVVEEDDACACATSSGAPGSLAGLLILGAVFRRRGARARPRGSSRSPA